MAKYFGRHKCQTFLKLAVGAYAHGLQNIPSCLKCRRMQGGGCKPAKYHLWCWNLFTWLIAARSISLHLSDSLHLPPPTSLTVIPSSRISQLSLRFIALHLPAYPPSPPIHPSASPHLFYSIYMYFSSPPFPSFSIVLKSLPISAFLHLSSRNPLFYFNRDISASTSLYHFSPSAYSPLISPNLSNRLFFLSLFLCFSAAGIVRKKQWCEMVPCLEDEGCDLLVNKSGWTCTQPGGRVKTTTVGPVSLSSGSPRGLRNPLANQ